MPAAHVHRLRVRYSECDMQGHVFNGHWLAYFDLASTELWRERVGAWDVVTARGIDLVVADAGVSFRSPARFDDEVDVEAAIARLGTTSIVSEFRGVRAADGARGGRAGDLLVEGRLVHVVVDAASYEKREIPGWVREALA